MAQELASTGRLAFDTERGRIESARASLRKSARWQATLAFGIPGVLSCAVLIATLVNYPGAWYELLLLSVVQVFVIGAVFTLPVLFSGGYSVIALDRRLRRDAAAGWPIEHVRGQVVWSDRRRALVAKANGRLLASPFFTQLKALPNYWDHFDQLAPGSYELELLRDSGFVLSAKPLGLDAPALDDKPGNIALRAAFRISSDDIAANRRGRASGAQRLSLLLANAWLLPALSLLGVGAVLTVRGTLAAPSVGTVFSALIAATLLAGLAYLAGCVAFDVARGELDSGAGLVQLRPGKTEERGTVGGMDFTIGHTRARVFQSGVRYRVYLFRHSRRVVSAELA